MSIRRTLLILFCMMCPLVASATVDPKLNGSDVFLGYSRTGSDTFYHNTGGLNGWDGALHIRTSHFLGVEGDVAHYGLGADSATPRTTTVMFGPRVTVKTMRVGLFVHALAGLEHSANSSSAAQSISGTALSYAIGGGVDVPVFPFFAWRFAADRISAPTQSPSEGDKSRFTTGLVFRF